MKQLLAAIAAVVLLSSCSTPAHVTPKPDVAPVRTSNRETIRDIKSTKIKIQESRKYNEKGSSLLGESISALDQLLNEP